MSGVSDTSKTSASAKKGESSPLNLVSAAAIDRLASQVGNFSRLTSFSDRIQDTEELLRLDEASWLQHHTQLITFADKYADIAERIEIGDITEDNILYTVRKQGYEACKNQILALEHRIAEIRTILTDLRRRKRRMAMNAMLHQSGRMMITSNSKI